MVISYILQIRGIGVISTWTPSVMSDAMEVEGTYLSRDGETRLYVLATSRYLVLWTAENARTRQAVGPAIQKAKRKSFVHLIQIGALVKQGGKLLTG